MSEERTILSAEVPLSVQALRELIREARGGFAPDYVGAILRQHYATIVESEANEIATVLRGLVEQAGKRLHDAGIEPLYNEKDAPQKLSKREREYVANVAMLARYELHALLHAGRLDDAQVAGEEALAWCRAIEDHRMLAMVLRDFTIIYSARQEVDRQEEGARRALAEAHLSGDISEIVSSIDFLCSFLVVQFRVDEAEELNEEGLALARMHEEARRFMAPLLLDRARIMMHRASYVEAITVCREALQWCTDGGAMLDRSMILSLLGTIYLRLGQYNQCIACHHEVIQIGEATGSDMARAWGYFRLAEAHFLLNEMDRTDEMLDRSEECASRLIPQLSAAIAVKRTQVHVATGRFEDAAELCGQILANLDSAWFTGQVSAHITLAEIAERNKRYEDAEHHRRRAIEISKRQTSQPTPALELSLAELLHTMKRHEEVDELLARLPAPEAMAPVDQVRMYHLRSMIAEEHGELEKALSYEREAFAVERELLERRAGESLRNARIVAETERLEREADQERERRRRLEHELADAIMALSDRKRTAESVEKRLHEALKKTGEDENSVTADVLSEALLELRTQARQQESPLRYLSGVDEDFYRRLRQRCPDLTSKQERLCALLRAGLGSKEIASLLGLGAEGLKAQRKRLRRRLGLSAEERLEVVLAEM